MRDEYFRWLLDLLGDDALRSNYKKLCWDLFDREFTWTVLYDKNRAADGLYLRWIFSEEYKCEVPEFPFKGCSVLEMMIACARDCEDSIMHNDLYGDRTFLWFWTMITNLGLDIYDDYCYYHDEVSEIVDRFLSRQYGPNGEYCMFPILGYKLENVDIWKQLGMYLVRNYPM